VDRRAYLSYMDTLTRASVVADLADCMVALPPQFFSSTQIPACLWFLARSKAGNARYRARRARDAEQRPLSGAPLPGAPPPGMPLPAAARRYADGGRTRLTG
jgi:hypothetical protein